MILRFSQLRLRILGAVLLAATLTALALQAHTARQAMPAALTTYVPEDALLTIESPDFARLLEQWESSAESKTWLTSANYSVFEASRLFGRLSDARDQFAQASGLSAGSDLLKQVAGTQSVFAWYDVGNLEFLYITRMPSAQSARTELLQARSRFERRRAGETEFYVRTTGSPARTVAFAQVASPSGDLLLLATREDLIANALNLIGGRGDSIVREPWFSDAGKALPAEASGPALHMVLNLDRIVPMPSFRTYWIQRNVTWMKQYRAAVSDLYFEAAGLREERVLLQRSPAPVDPPPVDLSSLAALPPPETGVYQAFATQDPVQAVTSIQEKILGHEVVDPSSSAIAPDPILEGPSSGSASDLETRIDTPAPLPVTASTEAVRKTIESTGLQAILTLSSAEPGAGLWLPIHSAVVLQGAGGWVPEQMAAALQQALRGSLTTSTLGIDFKPITASGETLFALTGPRPLFLATRAHLLLLSDDLAMMLSLLKQPARIQPMANATRIAAFNHATQRAPFTRLTSLIDGTQRAGEASGVPEFFSRNLASLSDTFPDLLSEQIVDRETGADLRQTVTYTFRRP